MDQLFLTSSSHTPRRPPPPHHHHTPGRLLQPITKTSQNTPPPPQPATALAFLLIAITKHLNRPSSPSPFVSQPLPHTQNLPSFVRYYKAPLRPAPAPPLSHQRPPPLARGSANLRPLFFFFFCYPSLPLSPLFLPSLARVGWSASLLCLFLLVSLFLPPPFFFSAIRRAARARSGARRHSFFAAKGPKSNNKARGSDDTRMSPPRVAVWFWPSPPYAHCCCAVFPHHTEIIM